MKKLEKKILAVVQCFYSYQLVFWKFICFLQRFRIQRSKDPTLYFIESHLYLGSSEIRLWIGVKTSLFYWFITALNHFENICFYEFYLSITSLPKNWIHMLDVHVDQPIKWWMEENIFSFLNVFLAPGEENIQTSEYTNFIFSGSDNCSRGILCIDFRGASDRNSCLWYVHNEITSQRLKKLQRHFKLGTVHEFKAVLR